MIQHWNEMTRFQDDTGRYEPRDYCLALMMEVSELTDSLPWKPWRSPENRKLNVENLKREIVDCLYFLHHIADAYGITPEDLDAKFVEVDDNNRRRYVDGDFSMEEEVEPSNAEIMAKLNALAKQVNQLKEDDYDY